MASNNLFRKELLLLGAEQLQIEVDADTADKLLQLLQYVLVGNAKLNLTSIDDPDEAIQLHLLDSLAGLRILDRLSMPLSVVDVGTGAGFPGLVLACARKSYNFLLMDSTRKKIDYVQWVVGQLGLENVTTLWSRAEIAGQSVDWREKFDVGLARAVAPLNVLVELVLPLVRVDGHMIAYKGPTVENEIKDAAGALSILGGQLVTVDYYQLPFDGPQRSLVWIRKINPSPARYPRRAGIPTKRPLQ